VAIPVVTLGVTPLALLGTLAAPLWSLAAAAVQGLDAFLALLAGIPGAVRTVPAAPLWAQIAGLAAAGLAIFPLPWRARVLALPLALALLIPPRTLPPEGGFDLLAADVGQGSAVLVRTRGHVLLFDAGPQYSRESDAGQRVLVPAAARPRRHAASTCSFSDIAGFDQVGGAGAVLRRRWVRRHFRARSTRGIR
jgi:competence protein ComEC